jgi:Zn-dependent M28 family amino/carboxypeptidase
VRSITLAVLALCLVLGVSTAMPSQFSVLQPRPGGNLVAELRAHLVQFQRIADQNGGTRLAGTPGYDASARYVAERMRSAGYRVRLQPFGFQLVADRTPPSLRDVGAQTWSHRAGRDYATLAYSGNGRVEARLVAVDLLVPSPRTNTSTSGCEASDFAGFPRGAVALLQRGSCFFRVKVENAVAAGASAVVVFNEGAGQTELFRGTLGAPQARIPALAASFGLGNELRNGVASGPTGVTVRLTSDMVAERRQTTNVIAESSTGRADNVVVVGAHLDSVAFGPGINDNATGSAVVLEAAERLAGTPRRNRLRFVWWGAEEEGLLGSRHYVRRLTPAARSRIALYLNFDMVGSRNFTRYVYDGDNSSSNRGRQFPAGSAAIERVFARYFTSRGLPHRETGLGGSDHTSFAGAGIPVGGLFTGADGTKSQADATAFGGRAGAPHDACYHRACDTIENVSWRALTESAQAALHAIRTFARDTTAVRRGR